MRKVLLTTGGFVSLLIMISFFITTGASNKVDPAQIEEVKSQYYLWLDFQFFPTTPINKNTKLTALEKEETKNGIIEKSEKILSNKGRLKKSLQGAFLKAVDSNEATGLRHTEGGTKDVNIEQITIEKDKAAVIATYTSWMKTVNMTTGQEIYTENKNKETTIFVNENGQWRVKSFTVNFFEGV